MKIVEIVGNHLFVVLPQEFLSQKDFTGVVLNRTKSTSYWSKVAAAYNCYTERTIEVAAIRYNGPFMDALDARMLPTPTCTFKVPNLNDDLELDCRLYFPQQSLQGIDYYVAGFAIFAHPYAPLGGSFDDGIVHTVGSILLKQGFVLCTFNFRGAANSLGSTSWTGKAELADYVSVYVFMLSLISAPEVVNHVTLIRGKPLLVLGGYSYGSMIASHLPDYETLKSCYNPLRDGSSDHEIELRAQELAKVLLGFIGTQNYRRRAKLKAEDAPGPSSLKRELIVGGYESDEVSQRIGRNSPRGSLDAERIRHSIDRVKDRLSLKGNAAVHNLRDAGAKPAAHSHTTMLLEPQVACMLVSPLLQPVAGFATSFSKLAFERKGITTTHKSQKMTIQNLSENPTLAIHGDRDTFTAARKLRKWTQQLQNVPDSQFQSEEVVGAGHFWIEEGVQTRLISVVDAWLSLLMSDDHRKSGADEQRD